MVQKNSSRFARVRPTTCSTIAALAAITDVDTSEKNAITVTTMYLGRRTLFF